MEMNRAVAEKLADLNHRSFQKMAGSRRSLYESIDRPALKALPSVPDEYAECKKARVNIDYHIEMEGHYYSVPYQLAKEQVEVWLTARTVEVLFKSRQPAAACPALTPAVPRKADTRPCWSTCPSPIRSTWNGPPPGSLTGQVEWDPIPEAW
jgi:hypothetical protein